MLQSALNVPGSLGTFMSHRLLSAHFIPFRSPSLAALTRKGESLRFGEQLWKAILASWTPRLIITIDRETYAGIQGLIEPNLGRALLEQREWPSGWGQYTCQSRRYTDGVTLARFPHLSRFGLFNRDASALQMQRFVAHLCGVGHEIAEV
jgi:hypothetical protein